MCISWPFRRFAVQWWKTQSAMSPTLKHERPKLSAANIALAAIGVHIGDTDDAPGAAVIGLLLMIGALVLAVRIGRRRSHPDRD